MRETAVELFFRNQVSKAGGVPFKFVSPGNRGVPDQLVLLPGGRQVFVELKKPGKKPEPLQLWRHDQFRKLGQTVYVIDTKAGVNDFVREVFGS